MVFTYWCLITLIWYQIWKSLSGPKNDILESSQLGFQDSLTPMAEGMIDSPHYLMFFSIVVCLMLFW